MWLGYLKGMDKIMVDNVVRLNEKDNVLVAIKEIQIGEEIIFLGQILVCAGTFVPYGHKIALLDIEKNNVFIKFGEIIGHALENVKIGEWVHNHNLG